MNAPETELAPDFHVPDFQRKVDPLGAARGVFVGVVTGISLWLLIGLAFWQVLGR
jgi:hypothetical protein